MYTWYTHAHSNPMDHCPAVTHKYMTVVSNVRTNRVIYSLTIGLTVYMNTSNILSILQQIIL